MHGEVRAIEIIMVECFDIPFCCTLVIGESESVSSFAFENQTKRIVMPAAFGSTIRFIASLRCLMCEKRERKNLCILKEFRLFVYFERE